MSFRDILTIVLAAHHDEAAIGALEIMAKAQDARASAALFEIQPDPLASVDGYVVGAVHTQILADAHDVFLAEKERVKARLGRGDQSIALSTVTTPFRFLKLHAGVWARHADLTILTQPHTDVQGAARRDLFEGALFGSGRPVLLMPRAWKPAAIGDNIVVGWNGRREAARALADAAPLLENAKRVTIVTVDAKPSLEGFGDAPGVDIAAHFARRGVKAELRNVDGMGRSDGKALLDEAQAVGADLVVLGGYGRARLQEMVFGGVTREVTASSPVPLFMSH